MLRNKCLTLFLVLDVTYYWCLSAVNQQRAVRLKNNEQSAYPMLIHGHVLQWALCGFLPCVGFHIFKLQHSVVSEVQLGSAYCKLVHFCEIKITTKYFNAFSFLQIVFCLWKTILHCCQPWGSEDIWYPDICKSKIQGINLLATLSIPSWKIPDLRFAFISFQINPLWAIFKP